MNKLAVVGIILDICLSLVTIIEKVYELFKKIKKSSKDIYSIAIYNNKLKEKPVYL